jgi:ferritin-like metal-binding protein YciE
MLDELGDVLYVERTVTKMLPRLAKEATDAELRKGFEHHLEETKQQIGNLERVFEKLGKKARAKKCPGIEGIKKEHDEFMSEHESSPQICDLFLTGAAARTEHYEIAAYSGLIRMARSLGESECAALLEENLRQEQSTLAKVESVADRFGARYGNGARVAA